ncbi:MAG: NAD(P)-binding domain-containing protein [Planctomycetota bacterium]|jgi:thioredoxin reductase
MSWTLLSGVVFLLGLALFAQLSRRHELKRMRRSVSERDHALREGRAVAQLAHPIVDLSRCLGCGTCIDACPEDQVLELVHGQAMVVNGASCKGHAVCESECPVDAITVTLSNVADRNDIPALDDKLEAVGSPGVFLAGEVTAHALIRTAVRQGSQVGAEVARRCQADPDPNPRILDLIVVGAGPAGLACSLEAKRHGLSFVTLEQETGLGGTVAKYPRRKLVMTQPVEMPLHGKLPKTEFTKEELIALWQDIATEHELPIKSGQTFESLERTESGSLVVYTQEGTFEARHVCLALGRRGIPQKLETQGEELPKVAYSLMDAHSYSGRRILVVGGGDSAVEAALGLAEQPGNEVTLSYRQDSFFRIRSKNRERLESSIAEDRVKVLYNSQVESITPQSVHLSVKESAGSETMTLPNDEVFVMVGGVPPFELLERSGVSFDAELRPKSEALQEQGSGLTRALMVGFGISLLVLVWALLNSDYYLLAGNERPAHPKHAWLRPGLGVGLWLGVSACVLIILNLLYLLRRASWSKLKFGSLQGWMTSHVATGILAFLCALLHSAMTPQDTPGGHAFWAMAAVCVTGAIGRYLYAYVPRAANGRELELAEVKAKMGRISEDWDQEERNYQSHVRDEVHELIERKQWRASFFGRLLALIGVQRHLNRTLHRLAEEGRAEGIDDEQIKDAMSLARRAHRTALMAAHYEDLRAILSTWRYFHRWVAALLVLLIAVHVFNALVYGNVVFDRGPQ